MDLPNEGQVDSIGLMIIMPNVWKGIGILWLIHKTRRSLWGFSAGRKTRQHMQKVSLVWSRMEWLVCCFILLCLLTLLWHEDLRNLTVTLSVDMRLVNSICLLKFVIKYCYEIKKCPSFVNLTFFSSTQWSVIPFSLQSCSLCSSCFPHPHWQCITT